MAIIKRAKRENKFSTLPNDFLRDSTLSFECRGMIAYLLSHTEDWKCRPADLEREGNIGKDARRRIMIEAEKAGYITFHSERLKSGQFNVWYDAHEEPVSAEERTQSWLTGKTKSEDSPGAGFPLPVQPVDGSAGCGQHLPILNTELPKTDDVININYPKANNLYLAFPEIPSQEIVEPSLANSPHVDSQEKPAAQPKAKAARKPQVDSGEGKASTPCLKTQPDPVSASPSAHQVMMAALADTTKQPILNGAAQGKAIKTILAYYSAEQGIEVLHWMADPKTNWRGKVDWLAVQNFIPEYFRRKAQQPPQEPKSNGFSTTKRDFSRIIANLPEHLR